MTDPFGEFSRDFDKSRRRFEVLFRLAIVFMCLSAALAIGICAALIATLIHVGPDGLAREIGHLVRLVIGSAKAAS